MYSFETIDIGEYRGDSYFFVGFVDPDPPEGEDFDPDVDADDYGAAVVRAASSPLGENRQMVRMDTSHGKPHMDKLYLPPDSDEDKKQWLGAGYEYRRMKRYLLQNWKEYVDLYIQYNE